MEKIIRKYYLSKDNSDYSKFVNRWVDHDGKIMKFACRLFDTAMIKESKKLVPYEKEVFYFYVDEKKIFVSFENTGFVVDYVVRSCEWVILESFQCFYDVLKYLYTDMVEQDLLQICKEYYEFNADAHSCRAEADEYGICTVCGAIVSGTSADYELHGYDPD